MVNHLYDIILTCGILVNGISGLDNGLTYEKYESDTQHTTYTASRQELFISCVGLGHLALSNGIENPDFILAAALHESKFATGALGIGANGLPLRDKRGHFLYHGLLQVTPVWTCPDTLGVPHGTWKKNVLDFNGLQCNADLSGVYFYRKLKKKHRKNEKALFCEYKKGHPCTDADYASKKNSSYLTSRLGSLNSVRKRVKRYKSNHNMLMKEMSSDISILLIPLLTASTTLVEVAETTNTVMEYIKWQ